MVVWQSRYVDRISFALRLGTGRSCASYLYSSLQVWNSLYCRLVPRIIPTARVPISGQRRRINGFRLADQSQLVIDLGHLDHHWSMQLAHASSDEGARHCPRRTAVSFESAAIRQLCYHLGVVTRFAHWWILLLPSRQLGRCRLFLELLCDHVHDHLLLWLQGDQEDKDCAFTASSDRRLHCHCGCESRTRTDGQKGTWIVVREVLVGLGVDRIVR